MKLKVIGLDVRMRVDAWDWSGPIAADTNDLDDTVTNYTLWAQPVDYSNPFYKIELSNLIGMCSSGWTAATWGRYSVTIGNDHAGPFNYDPIEDIFFELPNEQYEGVTAYTDDGVELYSCSYDGGDGYYPCGGSTVNLKLFKPNARYSDKRLVWIFHGRSGLGKTTLGEGLRSCLRVYETDSSDKLPSVITQDVVIVGNRSGFTVEDVVARLYGHPKVIYVGFNEVEVVRCRECKWWKNNDCTNDIHGYIPLDENDFCSRGQRREDGDGDV